VKTNMRVWLVFLFLVLMKHAGGSPKLFLVEIEDGKEQAAFHGEEGQDYSAHEEGQDYSAHEEGQDYSAHEEGQDYSADPIAGGHGTKHTHGSAILHSGEGQNQEFGGALAGWSPSTGDRECHDCKVGNRCCKEVLMHPGGVYGCPPQCSLKVVVN